MQRKEDNLSFPRVLNLLKHFEIIDGFKSSCDFAIEQLNFDLFSGEFQCFA